MLKAELRRQYWCTHKGPCGPQYDGYHVDFWKFLCNLGNRIELFEVTAQLSLLNLPLVVARIYTYYLRSMR